MARSTVRGAGGVARSALAAAAVTVVVLAGIWVAGGLVTDDAGTAKALTGAWFAASGLAAALLARARRGLALAVVGAWFVTSAATGGYLLVTSEVDRVVHEDVVVATSAAAPAGIDASQPAAAARAPVLEAAGLFRSGAHGTHGRASVVRTTDDRRVLTLTSFATAPGPDLRVYAVAGRSGVRNAVDLGRLEGNKGDQQYTVPGSTRLGSVVIWCRAFSVDFGRAVLHAAG